MFLANATYIKEYFNKNPNCACAIVNEHISIIVVYTRNVLILTAAKGGSENRVRLESHFHDFEPRRTAILEFSKYWSISVSSHFAHFPVRTGSFRAGSVCSSKWVVSSDTEPE